MSTIPSYPDLAEVVRSSPCAYALINAAASFQPRNRLLELNYAHDLLQTSGQDFTHTEIEDAFQKMADRGFGIVQTIETELAVDVIFVWSALPLVLQEGLRLGCLPSEFVSVPFRFEKAKALELAGSLESKGVPIVAVLNGGRTVKLEVPYQLSQLELAQIMRLLTSLRKSTSVEDAWPFPTGNEVDDTPPDEDPDEFDLDTDTPMDSIDEFDEMDAREKRDELPV